jgi:uncharacterized protein (TIGR02444 family)
MRLPPSPFWDFSVATYGQEGVAPACLSLQDRYGLDVNLLLYCCWSGARGVRLSAAELALLIDAVRAWQTEVVRRLRAVRRFLKAGGSGAPPDQAEALRQRVAAVELDAEHMEQLLLAAAIDPPDGRDGAGTAEVAARNLAAYARAVGLFWRERDAGDLAALLAGAFPNTLPSESRRLAEAIRAGSL